jgi:hypothetical protein
MDGGVSGAVAGLDDQVAGTQTVHVFELVKGARPLLHLQHRSALSRADGVVRGRAIVQRHPVKRHAGQPRAVVNVKK